MSTSRYLNWSRPSPGRHPLRKQMSCFESFSGGKSLSQNLSRRGSATFGIVDDSGPPSDKVNRRPASAHTTTSSSSGSSRSSSSSAMARRSHEGRKVFAKQLSLDSPMLSGGTGPAAGHAWTTDSPSSRTSTLSGGGSSTTPSGTQKQQGERQQNHNGSTSGIKKRPSGVGVKDDPADERNKKALLQDKDARINIKIFLGQTIQQDSSDNGVSDTECSVLQGNDTNRRQPKQNHPPAAASQPPQSNQPKTTETEFSHSSEVVESKAPKAAPPSSAGGSSTASSSGRSSSLAQRRAQFHASRQHSEANADRRPPLVRAMSAPNRPIEENPKFLQNKKKPRKKKVSRERDEINECDEDDFDEAESVKINTANNRNSMLGPRSRSVIGGAACDIETLVSLLSSGGSDSEKEDSTPNDGAAPVHHNIVTGSSFKARAPMLKKAGKSVSFQETELKQSAGLNRDYYTAAHRKPPSLQPIANRIRRSQQLASSFNAFHLRDTKKSSSEESKTDDDRAARSDDEEPNEATDIESFPSAPPTAQSNSTTATASETQDTGDGQTPKERECYRLYQKMSNMGLAVSYDTILRGMLTPTELRVLQKQRSKLQKQQESRQSSSEAETNDTSKSDEPLPQMAGSVCLTEEIEVTNEPVVIASELQQIVGQ
ncbi:nucleolar and coiled-body phosphoprotein 1 isoform X2 [Wyeomyia smithii]|uniref:nucleolar and coiled-body phosphoprotein 1 isoform X2 n=1 Tax=Wyeomyia smithii TaxID=174621 RepID=UPI002467FCB0|nr:nucleolar and coiled-body phosphoprotein 1 isoform X2 [Wyeomyia smithii]